MTIRTTPGSIGRLGGMSLPLIDEDISKNREQGGWNDKQDLSPFRNEHIMTLRILKDLTGHRKKNTVWDTTEVTR